MRWDTDIRCDFIIISMARYWILPRHEFVSGPRAGCLTDGVWDQQELCLVLSLTSGVELSALQSVW